MWSFYGIFPYRRNARKYLFAFYKAGFLFFLPPCYMKYYFLQEYGRLLSVYVMLHCWTLFSGSRNIANNFSPHVLDPSFNITLHNQTGTRGSPYNSILSLIKLLHHNSTLCVEWRIQGGARDALPLSVQILSFPCSFWQTICKIIGWNTPLGVGFPFPLENPGSATGMIKKCTRVL